MTSRPPDIGLVAVDTDSKLWFEFVVDTPANNHRNLVAHLRAHRDPARRAQPSPAALLAAFAAQFVGHGDDAVKDALLALSAALLVEEGSDRLPLERIEQLVSPPAVLAAFLQALAAHSSASADVKRLCHRHAVRSARAAALACESFHGAAALAAGTSESIDYLRSQQGQHYAGLLDCGELYFARGEFEPAQHCFQQALDAAHTREQQADMRRALAACRALDPGGPSADLLAAVEALLDQRDEQGLTELLIAESASNIFDAALRRRVERALPSSAPIACCNLVHACLNSPHAACLTPHHPTAALAAVVERVRSLVAGNRVAESRLSALLQRARSRDAVEAAHLSDDLLASFVPPSSSSAACQQLPAASTRKRRSTQLARPGNDDEDHDEHHHLLLLQQLNDDDSEGSRTQQPCRPDDYQQHLEQCGDLLARLSLAVDRRDRQLTASLFGDWLRTWSGHGLPADVIVAQSGHAARGLKILLSLCAGAIASASEHSSDSDGDSPPLPLGRYGQLAAWLAKPGASGDRQLYRDNCSQLRRAFFELAKRVQQLEPTRSLSLLCLGDAYFELGFHRRALGIFLQHSFFKHASALEPSLLSGSLQRMVHSLRAVHAYTQAAVLCQFFAPVDYDLAFRILQEDPSSLCEGYLHFFWEEPLLEMLISLFHAMKNARIVRLLVSLLQTPRSTRSVVHLKEAALQAISYQFLALRIS